MTLIGRRCQNRQKVLEACEAAIRRLTYDRRYFARPARSLFNDVRTVFHDAGPALRLARDRFQHSPGDTEFLEQLPEGVGLDGRPPQCNAHTRKGTPCQRTPLPGREYCPSHKHLDETFESAEIPDSAVETLDSEFGSLAAV